MAFVLHRCNVRQCPCAVPGREACGCVRPNGKTNVCRNCKALMDLPAEARERTVLDAVMAADPDLRRLDRQSKTPEPVPVLPGQRALFGDDK
jgi:hypothetical protein